MSLIEKLHHSLDDVYGFIEKYSEIGDVHMVDYFTKDHWNNLIGKECQAELLHKTMDDLYSLSSKKQNHLTVFDSPKSCEKSSISCLQTYLSEVESVRLESLNLSTNLKRIIQEIQVKDSDDQFKVRKVDPKVYMSNKKSHEVEQSSQLINLLSGYCGTGKVLDIGSGIGYLSTHLSLCYDLAVTAIDSNEGNTLGADKRAAKYLNYWKRHLNKKSDEKLAISTEDLKVKAVTAFVDADSNLQDFVQTAGGSDQDKCILTGLHTCGDLCSTLLSMFVNNECISGMCIVGCCYNHLTESFDQDAGFPMSNFVKERRIKLGRNKRMLGLKSIARTAQGDIEIHKEKSERSLFYRAILTVILQEHFNITDEKDYHVGKVFGKSKSFLDYVQKCLKKLKLNSDGKISDLCIAEYETRFIKQFKELIAFSMLREAYGPSVECIILLDKFLYLQEKLKSSNINKCFLTQLFDPVISPRCYAFIALR